MLRISAALAFAITASLSLAAPRAHADTTAPVCQDFSGEACNGCDLQEDTVTVCTWIDDTTPEASESDNWGDVVSYNDPSCGCTQGDGGGGDPDCTETHTCTF
jgi:hypothetical protein